MEGLLFLIILILVMTSLLRGGARQRRQQPPPRPRRPMLEPEFQEDPVPFPAARPARRTIFSEEKPAPRREAPARISFHADQEGPRDLFKDRGDLARGIILAEVLGPHLSKRKKRGFV